MSDVDSVENAWKGYVICNEAIVDPNNAWIEAQSLISSHLDPGLSKSQVLFWVITREGFSPSTTTAVSLAGSDGKIDGTSGVSSGAFNSGSNTNPDKSETASESKDGTGDSSAICSNHATCSAEKLMGLCCPTADGVFLNCCADNELLKGQSISITVSSTAVNANTSAGNDSVATEPRDKDNNGDSSPKCEENEKCSAENLVGLCCPTADGVFLGCCADTEVAPGHSISEATTSSAGDSTPNCEDNEKCSVSGLVGLCCPTANGAFLLCCT